MVCNGSPAKQIGRCVISPRDEWLHMGCMPEYTSSLTGCHAYKVAVVDGVKDVQEADDCSMRHADSELAYPVWRHDGGGNPRCATLEANEFLELKYYDGGRMLSWAKRLVMLDNGNLQVQYTNAVQGGSGGQSAPFEADYLVGASIGGADAGRTLKMGAFVPPYSRVAIGRPPYNATLTATGIELVNGLNKTYWRAPFASTYDAAYPIRVRWATAAGYANAAMSNLYVCGVLASHGLCDADDCSDQLSCKLLDLNL